jgi:hypothetical protein
MPLVWELSLIGIFEQITTVLRVSRARARYLVRNLTTTPERQGALQGVGESIEQLLPEDEQEKRRKHRTQAWWTINVQYLLSRT